MHSNHALRLHKFRAFRLYLQVIVTLGYHDVSWNAGLQRELNAKYPSQRRNPVRESNRETETL